MTSNTQVICERSLKELLPDSLTTSLCVNVRKNAEVWVGTGMLVQYLESFTDSIVVRDEVQTPIGLIGGKDIIEGVYKNPTANFFEGQTVDDIADRNFSIVSKFTSLKELIHGWRDKRRAFSLINNELTGYSAISAKKLLEIGMLCKSDLLISELPKKKVVSFNTNDTIEDIIKSMLDNGTRKLLLEDSFQYINDRLIIELLSDKLNFLHNGEAFMSLPACSINFEDAKVISEDMNLSDISKIMYEMAHPYVVYLDQVFSPWDVCLALLDEKLTEYGD